jgi:hypothetical protein
MTAEQSMIPGDLRRRARAIQVIGVPEVDRRATRQTRLGASLLVGLFLGWDSLTAAMSGPEPFHLALGRFVAIFVVTVASISWLGGVYDRAADEALANQRRASIAAADASGSTLADKHQPSPGVGEGLGSER